MANDKKVQLPDGGWLDTRTLARYRDESRWMSDDCDWFTFRGPVDHDVGKDGDYAVSYDTGEVYRRINGLYRPVGSIATRTSTPPQPVTAWPVGSVFLSVAETNPAVMGLPGTWAPAGEGAVLIGQARGQPADTGARVAKTAGQSGSPVLPVYVWRRTA